MSKCIKEINERGRTIILDDNTTWTVSSFESFDTRSWMGLDNVTVKDGKMTNHNQRDKTVYVRKKI